MKIHSAILLLAPAVAQAAEKTSGPLSEFAARNGDAALAPLAALFGGMGGYFNGTTGVIATAIKSINMFFFALAAVVVAWSIISGIMSSANNGRFLGGHRSATWAPLRLAIGGALLVPAWSGYTLANLIVAWALSVGVGLGNIVFSGSADLVQKSTGAPVTAPVVSDAKPLTRSILDAALCARAHNAAMARLRSAGLSDQLDGDPWTAEWLPAAVGDDAALRLEFGDCGGVAIAWPNRSEALPAAAYERMRVDQVQAVLRLSSDVWQASATLAPTPQDIGKVETAADTYQTVLETAWARSVAEIQADVQKHIIKTQQGESWLGAGNIVTASAAAARSGAGAGGSSKAIPAKKNSDPGAWAEAGKENAPLTWGNAMERSGSWLSDKWDKTKAAAGKMAEFVGSGDGIGAVISAFIDNQAKELARSIAATTPRARVGEMGSGAGGIAGLASFGANVVAWCGSALVSWTSLAAFVGTAQGTGVAAVYAAGGLISNLLTALMALGTLLSAWLPFLPSLLWTLAVVGFLFSAVTAMLSSPIWAILHLDFDGDGLTTPATKAGYLMLLNLLIRPALLVVFMLAATVIFDWSLGFIGNLVQSAIQSSITSGNGIQALVAAIGGTFFYLTAGLTLAAYVFGYILQGPDAVMATAGGAFSTSPANTSTPGEDPVGGALNNAADKAGNRGGSNSSKGDGDGEKIQPPAGNKQHPEGVTQ